MAGSLPNKIAWAPLDCGEDSWKRSTFYTCISAWINIRITLTRWASWVKIHYSVCLPRRRSPSIDAERLDSPGSACMVEPPWVFVQRKRPSPFLNLLFTPRNSRAKFSVVWALFSVAACRHARILHQGSVLTRAIKACGSNSRKHIHLYPVYVLFVESLRNKRCKWRKCLVLTYP